MAIISDIIINTVSVAEVNGEKGQPGYKISVNWQVKSAGGSFHGPFQVKIWQADTALVSQTVTTGYQFETDMLTLDSSKTYHAQAFAMQGDKVLAQSEKVNILLEKFQNIQASFQNRTLRLTWSQPSMDVEKGLVTVKSSLSLKRYITRFDSCLEIPFSDMTDDIVQTAAISFTAMRKDEKSYGPPTKEICCLFAQARLQQVNEYKKVFTTDKTPNGMDVTAVPSLQYQSQTLQDKSVNIKMYLTDGSGAYLYSSKQPCTETGKPMTFHFSQDDQCYLEGAENMYAGVMICGSGWANEEKPQENLIPLTKLEKTGEGLSHGRLFLQWHYRGARRPLSYQITAKSSTIYVPEESYSYEYTGDAEEEITVSPVFLSGTGPGITAKKNLLPLALYIEQKEPAAQIRLKGKTVGENTLSVILKEEIFRIPWEKDKKETSGPFTLTSNGGTYCLEADEKKQIAIKEFTDFFVWLEKQGMKRDRLVWLRDSLSRLLSMNITDSAVYAYGFEGDKLRCNITAGMRLKTEWETFRPQQLNQDEDYGFYATNVSYYDVGAVHPAGQEYLLHFDSFLNQMQGISFEEEDGNSSRGQAAGFRQSAGGELDLFHDKFRFPYYSIVYPQYYHPSTISTTILAGEHMMLLGSDSLEQMQKSLQMLEQEFVPMDEIPAAVTYFHGRTMMQPQIPVFLNQSPHYVPLGTRLKDLLETAGTPDTCLSDVRIRRPVGGIWVGTANTAERANYLDLCPLRAEDEAMLKEIVLLKGDVITCQIPTA